uniref:uncharacterized protein LOC131138282 isoform X1 n=1 Tax=Doryrhamphus excisus TaxID=161450 RepID=UPI0025AE36ED|nr:uncharacterized protein LOC131138282 isoform X1 [Doryrhamphus excisus]
MVKLKTTMLHQCSRKTLHHTTSSAPNICCLNGLRLLFCSCVAIVLPPPRTPVCQGSPQQINLLHPTLSSTSVSLTPTTLMSSLTTSINVLFGLPLRLLPGSILLPIYSLSVLWTCPNHLSLASLTLSPRPLACNVPLMYSFLIVSILVTPNENLSILISATSSSASCNFLSGTVSRPNNMADLTTVLYTFPFILAETLLSQY